jgi:hypothetical protein
LTLSADGDTVVPSSFSTFITYGTGFNDVEIGPDGCIYLTSGSDTSGRIVRVSPIAPAFTSTPLTIATQDSLYSYTPLCSGSPPVLSLLTGPDGMYVDSSTWSIRWKPTNLQALRGLWSTIVRAENGAGSVDQAYTIRVANVNDPPNLFFLKMPNHDTTLSFVGSIPTITFAWENAGDPDGDTLDYTLEIDTVGSFKSHAGYGKPVGSSTSVTLPLPRVSKEYFWRVVGSDGEFSTTSSDFRRVVVSFVVPQSEEQEEVQESGLEQNFPNPFNPNTKITYTIPKSGPVRLAVFNLLGQEVTLIFEGYQQAGTHEIEFNSSSLPTGIYFYRIQASEFVETKKMVIAK